MGFQARDSIQLQGKQTWGDMGKSGVLSSRGHELRFTLGMISQAVAGGHGRGSVAVYGTVRDGFLSGETGGYPYRLAFLFGLPFLM
jgi:hypothetical protein